MSDFDREAERERLREKYERDQQKREATEQMSELLLQGATMTNAHCSDCGDPIFRYEGQEFCATCEKPVNRDTGGEDDADGDGDETRSGQAVEVTTPSEGRVVFGSDGADASESAHQRDQSAEDTPRERDETRRQTTTDDGQRATTDRARDGRPARAPAGDAPRETEADVAAAHDALVRTLVRFSQQAEATEDPRQAREQLQAAREAAAALAELRR